MNRTLCEFILKGGIGELFVGKELSLPVGEWASSFDAYDNGSPKLYKGEMDGLVMNVGVTVDRKVQYLVCHLKDQLDPTIAIEGASIDLSMTGLDELLAFFNDRNVEWVFSKVFEKVIFIFLPNSKVEMIFSFFPGEQGLLTIQVM